MTDHKAVQTIKQYRSLSCTYYTAGEIIS